jgi:hypothetical protein
MDPYRPGRQLPPPKVERRKYSYVSLHGRLYSEKRIIRGFHLTENWMSTLAGLSSHLWRRHYVTPDCTVSWATGCLMKAFHKRVVISLPRSSWTCDTGAGTHCGDGKAG